MNNPLVSVVVPIYNMELYVRRCIDSILKQTYTNFEVILVDDGSKDDSALICDEYALRYNHIDVIHKQNGGLSDARNCGIDASNGEYIMFVDADDYLEPSAMEVLVCTIIKAKTYVVQMKNYIVNADFTIRANLSNNTCNITTIPAKQFIFNICNKISSESVCDKLFDRKIFEKTRFQVGKLNEDFLFLSDLLMNNLNIAEVDFAGYYYYQRPGSISHSGVGKSLIDSIKNGLDLANQAKLVFPEVELYYKRYSLYQARSFFLLIPWYSVVQQDKYFIDILDCVRKMKSDIFATNLSIIDKLFLSILLICPKCAIACAKLVYKLI